MRSSLGRNRRRTELRRERHRRQSRLAVSLVPKLINEKKLERSPRKDRTYYSLADAWRLQLNPMFYTLIEHALYTNDGKYILLNKS